MKMLSLIFVTFIFAAGTLFAQKDYSYLDNDKGTSMEPILAAARPLVERIENEVFEIVRMEFDLIFGKKKHTELCLMDGRME